MPTRTRTLAAIALLACSPHTFAEDTLPEIVVTADFRTANEMAIPVSVTVLTEEVISERGAAHLEDLLGLVPNVNYAAGSNRARFLQIRGIGERSQFAAPLNPSVGVLIDNVDFSGAGTVATTLDVAQVEVLRGPQGTRYGANALAGLVNIRTNDPEDEFGANISASIGQYNTRSLGAVVTGPISDSVRGRLAVGTHQSDGYYDNAFLNVDDTNARDELTARAKLVVDAADNWSLKATLAHADIDNGYDAFSLDNTRVTLSDEPGFDRQSSTSFALESSWAFAAGDLEMILGLADSDIGYGYDEDWSFTGIHPFGYTSTDSYLRDRKTRSLEVRWVSTERAFADSVDWVAGAYFLDSEEDLTRVYTFLPGPFTAQYDFDTLAVFGELTFHLGDHTRLQAGLRGERRDTIYRDGDGVGFTPEEDLWGGRLVLERDLADRILLYGSIARGYKAGGFNTDGTLDADLREFDSEYLIEYEGGIKAVIANGSVKVRAALFHDDRRDQQVKSSIVRVRPDLTTEFIDFLGNAATGTNQGLELEMQWLPTPAWQVNASVGFLDASFDEFINEFGEDLSGRDQAQAPDYMYSLGANYSRGSWFAGLSIDGKDSYFFSDRHSVTSDDYTLVNARVGFDGGDWRAYLWGRNLGDEDVFTRGFGSFGNDPRKNYITEPYRQFGEPRVVGLTVEASFR